MVSQITIRWLELEGNDKDKAIANIRYFYAHIIDGVKIYFLNIWNNFYGIAWSTT